MAQTALRTAPIILTAVDDTARGQEVVDVIDTLNVPDDVQSHLDVLLDYCHDNALRPHLQICGDPLHVVSSLIVQLQKSLPETLANSGKIVLDFLIGQITTFCRNNNAGRISFSFEFKR